MIKFGAPMVEALEKMGVTPIVTQNFDDISAREMEIGKKSSHPMLLPERNDFVRGSAFWLFLEKEGETIAGLASKFDDLSNESLESYLRRTSRGQYGRVKDPIGDVDPMIGFISGKIVYTGELCVKESERGNTKVLTRLARLMQLLAYAQWDLDWMYGFVSEEHTKLNKLYGFSMVIHEAMTWQSPEPKGRMSEHAILASSRRQLELLFKRGMP